MNVFKDRIGLSLLEIIVALLILSLVMYGLTSLFTVGKGFVYRTGSRVVSMEIAKFFFEDQGLTVSADNYTSNQNCLYNGSVCVNGTATYNGIAYNINYYTSNVTNFTNADTSLRKVIINVSWTDPS